MITKKNKNKMYPISTKINGANIYLYYIPNKTIYASAMITGSRYKEDKQTCGISHLLEHVIVNSYKKCNYSTCAFYLQKNGLNYNALTSSNFIKYYISGLKEDTLKILDYLLDIINFPVIKAILLQLYVSLRFHLYLAKLCSLHSS